MQLTLDVHKAYIYYIFKFQHFCTRIERAIANPNFGVDVPSSLRVAGVANPNLTLSTVNPKYS